MEDKIKIFFFFIYGMISINEVCSSPKTVTNHKINLGWPNFFNPEIAILRKNKEKYESSSETNEDLENENDIDEYSDSDLIDYTIMGGLRGKIFMMNSSSCSDYIPSEITSEIHKILQIEKEENKENEEFRFNEEEEEEEKKGLSDPECIKGETTEKGLHLRSPLINRQQNSLLGKYGSVISVGSTSNPLTFIHYGNWCGRGGRSAPIDEIDRCCLEHDKCYGTLVRDCPDVWKKPYQTMYAWSMIEQIPICVRSESICINKVCDCDRRAAKCFIEGIYSKELQLQLQNQQLKENIEEKLKENDQVEREEEEEEEEEEEIGYVSTLSSYVE